jgi:hypothetical protein
MVTLSIHRKEQWDLNCWPLVCVHLKRTDSRKMRSCKRLFCLWRGGIQVGSRVWRWQPLDPAGGKESE